ncbi:MAG: prepilin-type N-terminal cleavage/methylation domain-containing protein [Phycisphaerales bacterium]|nr:prepilin-type N-terminal cleavage/methylation domain-containing protein [Phycisphaerales bacterium]
MTAPSQFHRRDGFTLIELLVVIAIIAVLVGLVVVALGGMMTRSKSAADLMNHRGLAKADAAYAADHEGQLLSPRTTELDNCDATLNWVWNYGVHEESGTLRIGTEYALMDGPAWEYIGLLTAYKSPLDDSAQVRSYSLSAYVGVFRGANDDDEALRPLLDIEGSDYWQPCLTTSQVPQPSATMCSISEEAKAGPAKDGFYIHPDEDSPEWATLPAAWWEPGRVNVSLLDGSTRSIRFDSGAGLRKEWLKDIDGYDIPVESSLGQNVNDRYNSRDDYGRIRKLLLPGGDGDFPGLLN